VAHLGGRGEEKIVTPFNKLFSIVPSKAEWKNEFALPLMASKSDFYLKSPFLLRIHQCYKDKNGSY
jgi:hypothetical protein